MGRLIVVGVALGVGIGAFARSGFDVTSVPDTSTGFVILAAAVVALVAGIGELRGIHVRINTEKLPKR